MNHPLEIFILFIASTAESLKRDKEIEKKETEQLESEKKETSVL